LEWTTVEENERHACEMGLKWSKLSREEVVEIKHLLRGGRVSFKDLAERFDVPVHTVYQINDGRIWRHVEGFEYPIRMRPRKKSYLSKAKISRAKALLSRGCGYRVIAEELGMGKDTIRKVRDGEYDWRLKK
jgi:transposase